MHRPLLRLAESRRSPSTVKEYRPSHEIYADGAAIRRWIELPPGGAIDVSDPNEWTFPIGTKFWMEFRLHVGGRVRPVETRLLVEAGGGFVGPRHVRVVGRRDIGPGGNLRRPQRRWRRLRDPVAGDVRGSATPVGTTSFSATSRCFSRSRAPPASTTPPRRPRAFSRRRTASTRCRRRTSSSPAATASASALGYLEANCGVSCHSGKNQWNAAPSGFALRLDVGADGTPRRGSSDESGEERRQQVAINPGRRLRQRPADRRAHPKVPHPPARRRGVGGALAHGRRDAPGSGTASKCRRSARTSSTRRASRSSRAGSTRCNRARATRRRYRRARRSDARASRATKQEGPKNLAVPRASRSSSSALTASGPFRSGRGTGRR